MLILAGLFEVDPEQREAFVAGRHDSMAASRAEDGCLDYVLSADPLESDRVVLFERWESQAALDAHLARIRTAPPPAAGSVAPRSVTITVYDIAGSRPLF